MIAQQLGLTKLLPKFEQKEEAQLGKRTNLMAFGEIDQNCQNSLPEIKEPSPKRPATAAQTSAAKLFQRFRERNEVRHRQDVTKPNQEEEQIDTSSQA